MFISKYFNNIKQTNAGWKEKEISVLMKNGEKVLDFGCGDLMFASALLRRNKTLKITGLDVVNSNSRKGIGFVKYDGNKIPFKDNYFDTVISIFVFHHCTDAYSALKECLRVAKKRVIFIEATSKYKSEILPMKFVDWLSNIWKPEPIPLTFQFKTIKEWDKLFKSLKIKKYNIKSIKSPLSFLPFGKSYLFNIEKK